MIHYVKGNICDAPESLIIHGCNMQGVMGAGVAKAIRSKWPLVYTSYKAWCETAPSTFYLGGVQTIPVEWNPNKYVANLLSQQSCGTDGRKYASYIAIVDGLRTIADQQWLSVAMPKIGCGLGGLDWAVVGPLVDEIFSGRGIDVRVYEL